MLNQTSASSAFLGANTLAEAQKIREHSDLVALEERLSNISRSIRLLASQATAIGDRLYGSRPEATGNEPFGEVGLGIIGGLNARCVDIEDAISGLSSEIKRLGTV